MAAMPGRTRICTERKGPSWFHLRSGFVLKPKGVALGFELSLAMWWYDSAIPTNPDYRKTAAYTGQGDLFMSSCAYGQVFLTQAHSKIPLVELISKRKDGFQKWWCNKDLGQIFSLQTLLYAEPLDLWDPCAATQVRPSSATGLQPSRLCDLALWFTGSICSIK